MCVSFAPSTAAIFRPLRRARKLAAGRRRQSTYQACRFAVKGAKRCKQRMSDFGSFKAEIR